MSAKGTNRISILRDARARNPDAEFSELVPECEPESHASLVELACIDLIDRLRSGRRVRVEEYVSSVPALQDDEDLLDLIDAEVCVRQELGKPADRDELSLRFPALSSAIDRMFFLDDLEDQIRTDNKPAALLPKVDGYRLRKQLCSDATSTTYSAIAADGGRCLFRVFADGSRDNSELLNALESVAAFQEKHPSILPIEHIGTAGTRTFYTTPLVDGVILSSLISKPVEPKKAAEWLRGIAIAFAFAEAHGASLGRVSANQVLIDHHNIPRVIGYCGQPSEKCDILRSLGEVGFEMLAGTPQEPTSPGNSPQLDDTFQQILNQCLSTGEPSGYRDVETLIDELTAYLSGRTITHQSGTGFLSKLFRRK